MELQGLGTNLPASTLLAWEDMTADYFESYYNDNPATGVSNVVTEYDVSVISYAQSRRRKMLRVQRRVQAGSHMFQFSQSLAYEGNMDVQDVVEGPFKTDGDRADYVAFLKQDSLFASLTGVSGVFLPQPLPIEEILMQVPSPAPKPSGANGGANVDANVQTSGNDSGWDGSGNPFGDVPGPAPEREVFRENFYCHNRYVLHKPMHLFHLHQMRLANLIPHFSQWKALPVRRVRRWRFVLLCSGWAT